MHALNLKYAPLSFLLKHVHPNLPQLHAQTKLRRKALICWQRCFEAANRALAAAGHPSRTAPLENFPFPPPFPYHAAAAVTDVSIATPIFLQILALLTYCMRKALMHGIGSIGQEELLQPRPQDSALQSYQLLKDQ